MSSMLDVPVSVCAGGCACECACVRWRRDAATCVQVALCRRTRAARAARHRYILAPRRRRDVTRLRLTSHPRVVRRVLGMKAMDMNLFLGKYSRKILNLTICSDLNLTFAKKVIKHDNHLLSFFWLLPIRNTL